MEQVEFNQYYPSPGWVEHNPEEIWDAQLLAAKHLLKKLKPEKMAAIGIANQRETTNRMGQRNGEIHP